MMARVKLESHVSHAVRARWAVPVGASGRDALVRHLVYAFLRSDPEGATDWIDSTVPTDPDELRTMLAEMSRQGLVRVSRGRGGSQLTPEGRKLAENG